METGNVPNPSDNISVWWIVTEWTKKRSDMMKIYRNCKHWCKN